MFLRQDGGSLLGSLVLPANSLWRSPLIAPQEAWLIESDASHLDFWKLEKTGREPRSHATPGREVGFCLVSQLVSLKSWPRGVAASFASSPARLVVSAHHVPLSAWSGAPFWADTPPYLVSVHIWPTVGAAELFSGIWESSGKWPGLTDIVTASRIQYAF